MRLPRYTEPAPLGEPLCVINLKCYPGAVGPGALRIGATLARARASHRVAVAVAPSPADIGRLARGLAIPVLAQHVDPIEPGAHTGFLPARAIRAAGARGSLVNHSEHRLAYREAGRAVALLRRERLVAVLCAGNVAEAARLALLKPDYLAVEPPELIGGKLSVSEARPEVIAHTVEAVARRSPSTRVLCGAGIHSEADVARALELGARGILVASAVAAARSPARALDELLAGFG